MKRAFLSLLITITITGFSQRQEKQFIFETNSNSNFLYKNILKEFYLNQNFKKVEDIKQMPKYDRPDLAAEFDFMKTLDPKLGYVPVERLVKARKYAKQLLANKSAIPDVTWQERGPNNIGGRTRALMFDPNDTINKKVWAGSVSGGLWTNNDITDITVAWENVNDFWANIAISCITYDVNNTNIFYVGTGEGWSSKLVRGAGIWKSINAGTDWEQLASTDNSQFYYVQKLAVSSTSRIFAATNDGLFISDNGGNNWTQVKNNFFADIEIAANGDIYAAEGSRTTVNGKIYKSTNNGDDWTDITPTGGDPERIELALAPSDSNVVYAVASRGTDVEWMKKSVDAGDSWTDLMIPSYLDQSCSESSDDYTRGQAWYDLIMIVHPTNSNYILAGGIDIHRSTDGGYNWESISYWTGACATYVHADQHAMLYRPGNSNEAIFGCDGGVFYADDVGANGNNFIARNKNYNVTQFYACASKNEAASNYFLAGAQDNGTQKFTQFGMNSTTEASGGDGAFCFIDQDNPDIQITSYVYNVRYISDDGGNSFQSLTNDYTGSFICPADYDSETDILYSSYLEDQILVSDIDAGSYGNIVDVDSLSGNQASAIKVSPFTQNTIFVGTFGGDIFKITNANTSPVSANLDASSNLPYGTISSIDIGVDENNLLITFSNYGLTSVWETTDGGNTWINKEGNLPDMPIHWCLYNPLDYNEVLLATDVGVWSTTNLSSNSPNWEPTVTELSNVRCEMLKYRESDALISVATYGRGLFTTDAFGSQMPIAQFDANTNIACLVDTITFRDISTKNPTSWHWSFTPSTISYVNGTDENSVNPEVIFNTEGNYSVELIIANATGSDTINKLDYISVAEACEYIMTNDDLYTCDAKFYDPGYTGNYPAGQDYIYTIYPTSENAKINVDFNSFYVEAEDNCIYDWLKIYDAPNSNSGLLGQFCGISNPGSFTATNLSGALTFVFHADGGVEKPGWLAYITCIDEPNNINNIDKENNFEIYPNPATSSLKVRVLELSENISVYDIYGRTVLNINKQDGILDYNIDLSNINSGVYFIKVGEQTKRFIKL